MTKLACDMIKPDCKLALKESTTYSFDTEVNRDTYFSVLKDLLINDSGRTTLAFVGDTSLKYYYWNGPSNPSVYDPSNWVEVKTSIDHTVQADTLYWGDPNVDLSMRARRDTNNGNLIFERRISGAWEEKFRISDSVLVDTLKLIDSTEMPIVRDKELGLYSAVVKDSEHGNQEVLRPVFMDEKHNHYMMVAALPDGSLRVPQNVDAALADPTGTPLTYKRVILEDQGSVIRDALEALPDGQKLPHTAISGLPSAMTGQEIAKAIEDDSAQINAENVRNLAGTEYYESDQAILIDPIDKTYIEIAFEHTGDVIQTMPNIINSREGLRVMIRNIKTDGSTVTLVPANSGQTIDGSGSYVIDPNTSVLFILMKDRSSFHKELEQDHSTGVPTVGITLDDGTTDSAGVTKLNVKGSKITGLPNQGNLASGEIELTSGPSIHMAAPNEQFGLGVVTEVIVEPPLSVFDDPSSTNPTALRFEIEHDAYEPMHKPSFLAYIADDLEIVGRSDTGVLNGGTHHDGTIYFDDIVWPAGEYIEINKDYKKYGIQEADTLDPNVSGGTDYLLAFRAHMRGVAPSDGYVRIYMYNASIDPFNPTGILLDRDDNPMAVQRNYKAGEELGSLDLMGIVNAKGLQEFTCHIVNTFVDDTITLTDRTEGATGLLIQAITSEAKTGVGLQQFELDTGQNIEFSSHYLGPSRMSIGFIVQQSEAIAEYTAGDHFISSDGYRLINPTGIKVGVDSGHLVVKDDGANIADFNFGKVFSAEETRMLRGKKVKVSATLTDKQDGYEIALMKWTGIPDKFTPEIFTTRNNNYPIMQTGWNKVDSLFISEDAVGGDHDVSKTFTVPVDSNNYAIIIYPVSAQIPINLRLKKFEADVEPPFLGYALTAPELLNEIHLQNDDRYARIVADRMSYASFRYTINNVPSGMPMPVGKIIKGAADISIDHTVNQVAGSSDHTYEGAIKFNADGDATISTQLLVWSEKTSSTLAQTKFWWSRVSEDGNSFTKIADSELIVNVRGGTKAINTMPTFKIQVETGQRIALFATTSMADGAFIQATAANEYLVDTTIDFKELVAGGQGDDPELVNIPYPQKMVVDRRVVSFSNNDEANFTFALEVPDDVEVAAHSVVYKQGNKVVSLDSSEFSYDTINKEMTVHVGSVSEGKIYLTFWG